MTTAFPLKTCRDRRRGRCTGCLSLSSFRARAALSNISRRARYHAFTLGGAHFDFDGGATTREVMRACATLSDTPHATPLRRRKDDADVEPSRPVIPMLILSYAPFIREPILHRRRASA